MKPSHVATILFAIGPSMFAQAAPTLVDDFYTPDAAVFTVAAPGFLANDISVAGGLVATSILPGGLQGTVVAFPNGSFTFTPTSGLATDTSFQYRATDSSGGTSTATVTFRMTSTLPVANPDSYTLTTPVLNVPAGTGFLVNDTGGIGALTAISITNGVDHGTLVAFPDGRFTYTPDSGFAGIDAFTYRISDAVGRASEATVTIDASTNLPVANPDSYTLTTPVLNVPAGTGFLVNDTGGIGAVTATSITNGVDHGTLVTFPDGRFTYTPDSGFAGIDAFTYRIRDTVGRTSEATVTIDASTNLPVAVDDVYDVAPDLLFSILAPGFLANDTGGIGELVATAIVDAVDHGSLIAFPDGSFTYTPDLSFAGVDAFTYRMRDDVGRASEATVTLRVGLAPSEPVPEPGTLSLMLLGGMATIGATRRRRAS